MKQLTERGKAICDALTIDLDAILRKFHSNVVTAAVMESIGKPGEYDSVEAVYAKTGARIVDRFERFSKDVNADIRKNKAKAKEKP